MPGILLTCWLTDCSSSGLPHKEVAEGPPTSPMLAGWKTSWGREWSGALRLAREACTRKAGQAGCPGARLGQVTWRQMGLLLTHASHQYPEPAWRGISKQSHNWVLLRPRQNTQAHISNRRVINLIGPSSRISAFWQASSGAEEVRGQV